jgi:hypothetical protein
VVPSLPVASDVAFGMVFAVFVAALVVLAFLAIRWGVRRDRAGRDAWRKRRLEVPSAAAEPGTDGAPFSPRSPDER